MKKATKILMIIATLIITVSLFVACNTGQHSQNYTVTFETNGGSPIASKSLSKIDAEPVTTRENYDFAGWYDNAELSGSRITFPYTLTKDTTLYAKWTEKQSGNPSQGDTVTFVTNGGSAVAQMTVTSIATEPVTTRDDYSFLGWYDNATFSGNRIAFPYTVVKATTLYAKWEEAAASKWVQTTLADYETEQNEDGSINILSYLGSEKRIILPVEDNVTFDKQFLFKGDAQTIEALQIPANIIEVDPYWFACVDTLKEISVAENHTALSVQDGILFSKDGSVLISYPTSKSDRTSYTIPSTVKTVGDYAVYGNIALEHIVVSEGVEALNFAAFYYIENLKTISLPSTLVTTGGYCLAGNSLLTEIEFPSTLTSWNSSSLYACSGLKRLIGPSCMRVNGISSFANLEYLEINGGTSIFASAYANCAALETVVIGSGIESIGTENGSGAFSGCAKLKNVSLPEGLTLIGAGTFNGCESLDKINIPSTVQTIGKNAFNGCTVLKQVTVPDGTATIGRGAFDDSGIEELRLSANITSLKLTNVTKLKTLYCAAGLLTKAYSGLTAFEKSPIQNLTVISGSIPNTSGSSYTDFASLHTLVIGEGVTEINEKAFSACHALVQITNLSGVEWSPQELEPGTSTYKSRSVEYRTNSSTEFKGVISDEANGFVKYSYNGEVRVLDCDRSITSLSASDFAGYTSIGAYAFINCTALTSVVIPSNINSVGIYAFRWCSEIASLTIEEGVQSIGTYAFCPTVALKSVTIPQSVTTIGMYAFTRDDGLDTLTINVKRKSSAPAGWHSSWYQKVASITVNWNA